MCNKNEKSTRTKNQREADEQKRNVKLARSQKLKFKLG